ncbi:MAG: metal-dependent hydrolase [Caulobacteraceae bacterium]|nr:metal-dependent hydrolase [Caulobacteraceae bacterium]
MRSLISRLTGQGAYQPGQVIEVGGWPVELAVSSRSKRVSLRIDRSRRQAVASAPSLRRLAEAAQFAQSRQAWIGERLTALPAPIQLAPGAEIALFGRPLRLAAAPGRARLDPETGLLTAPGDAAFGARAARLIKAQARLELTRRTEIYARRLDRPTPAVSVTDARRRWGSCSPARPGAGASIRYNWRLALAPETVADYVVAHECAHLAVPDHSPRFWALTGELYGDVRPAKAWLRAHGDRLHAVTI